MPVVRVRVVSPAVALIQLVRSREPNVAEVLEAPEELAQVLHVLRLYAGLEDLELVLPAINASLQLKLALATILKPGSTSVSVGHQVPPHVTLFRASLTSSLPRQMNSVARQSRSSYRAGAAAWLVW